MRSGGDADRSQHCFRPVTQRRSAASRLPEVRDGALSRLFAFSYRTRASWSGLRMVVSTPQLHAPNQWPVKPRQLDACRTGVCRPTSSTAYDAHTSTNLLAVGLVFLGSSRKQPNLLACVVARIDCVSHRCPQRPPHSTMVISPGEAAWVGCRSPNGPGTPRIVNPCLASSDGTPTATAGLERW